MSRLPYVFASALAMMAAMSATQDSTVIRNPPEQFTMRVVASGLAGPWEITWAPDQHLWITERQGKRILRVNPVDGSTTVLATIADVYQSFTQDGLLGMALHPDLLRGNGNDYVYVALTYDADPGPELQRRLAVRRYTYDRSTSSLTNPMDLLSGLPTHTDHVGGRLAINRFQQLYLTIGDQGSNFGENRCNANHAQELPSSEEVRAKNWTHYEGKILRFELDGSVPPLNPMIDGVRSHVFSYGHRNPLGLVVAPDGKLYESEHGPSSDDEVNLIEAGRNYGWPNVAGYRDDKAYVFANWSASSPEPCRSLPRGAPNTIPSSVPTRTEMSWTDARFMPPLRTFFTVETGYDLSTIGSATIAPGGLDLYTSEKGIPGWNNSLLVLSLIRGTVFRLPLAADGRSVTGAPIELFKTANRYRDVALSPDQRKIYLATDAAGPYRDPSGKVTQALANPGSILEFTYNGK